MKQTPRIHHLVYKIISLVLLLFAVSDIKAQTISGTFNVGQSQTTPHYTDITSAINNIITKQVNGNIVLELNADYTSLYETFPITLKPFTSIGGNWTITIKPAPGLNITITGSSSSGILTFANTASGYIVDGSNNGTSSRNLFINNDITNNSQVVKFDGISQNQGVKNSTLKNTIIKGAGKGILIDGAGEGHNNLSILNNAIYNNNIAIYLFGYSASSKIKNTTIESNEIGTDSTVFGQVSGIFMSNTDSTIIHKNHIYNLRKYNSDNNSAILLHDNSTNTIISSNTLNSIHAQGAYGYGAYGINLVSTVGISNTTIVNNSIYDLSAGWGGYDLNIHGAFGISLHGGTNTKIYYNTVNLYGQASVGVTTNASAALQIWAGAFTGVDVRNNIFSNTMTGFATASKFYAYWTNLSTPGAGVIFDYNNFYVSGIQCNLMNKNGTDVTSLASLKTATAANTNSLSIDPLFNNNTILTLLPGSPMLNGGTNIVGYTTDKTGTTRSALPTLGAEEATVDVAGPLIFYTPIQNSYKTTSTLTLTGFATMNDFSAVNTNAGTKPRIYYKKKGDLNAFGGNTSSANGWKWTEATNASSPYNFAIDYTKIYGGLVIHKDTIQYFVTAQDINGYTSANPSEGFAASSVANVTKALLTPNEFIVSTMPPLSGTYTIGATGTYTTITEALESLNLRGVSGPVIFELKADYSATAETFPIVFKPVINSSSINTVTLKPAAGAMPSIEGTNNLAIIKFAANAANYIIDGSNNATNTRDLFVYNLPTVFTSGIILLEGLSDTNGVKNVVIKNLKIKGTGLTGGIGILVGGPVPGFTAEGAGHDHITIQNNIIYNCGIAIATAGKTTSKVNDILITNNEIGTDSANLSNLVNGIRFTQTNGGIIHQNKIFNIIQTDGIDIAGIGLLDGVTNSLISNNTITRINLTYVSNYSATGIDVNSNIDVSNDTIINNMISDIRTTNYSSSSLYANPFGIRLNGGSGIKVYHNTVHLSGVPAGGSNPSASAALLIMGNGTYPNLDIRNNIFTNSMTGVYNNSKHAALWTTWTTVPPGITFDFNNFYASGKDSVLYNKSGTFINTLALLKTNTSANTNSKSVKMNYITSSDLHLGALSNGNLNLTGTPIATVNKDIDNNSRSVSHPYIGAHEASIPLPVELLSFTAALQNGDVQLQWVTASEINNKGFIIERSADNTLFSQITFVKGKGNSNIIRNYAYRDISPFTGSYNTLYYRLVQLADDGLPTIGKVTSVTTLQNIVPPLNIFPNPFTTEINIDLSDDPEIHTIAVTDMNGCVLLTQKLEKNHTQQSLKINLSHLNPGIYFLKTYGKKPTVSKLVKTN